MKRSALLRKTPIARGGSPLVRSKPLARAAFKPRAKALERKPLKAKRRKPKAGDEPAYKAFVKKQPCCVGGLRCGRADAHHLIDGDGEARKGMGQTAPDRFLFAMCRRHHDEFHDRKGFCRGWDNAQRLTYQQDEVSRLRAIWDDLRLLGVLQEPERKAC